MTDANEEKTPEQIQNFEWFIGQIQENWRTIISRPVLVAIFIAFLLGYYGGRYQDSDRIGVKDERISFLNDEVGAYRDRLNGASPDQAAKKITDLQQRVETEAQRLDMIFPPHPRKLSANEMDKLNVFGDQLRKMSPLYVIASTLGDSLGYALNIDEFLTTKEKMQVIGPMQAVCSTEEQGLMVGVADINKPSAKALELFEILLASGLKPHFTLWKYPVKPADFDIFVCPGV